MDDKIIYIRLKQGCDVAKRIETAYRKNIIAKYLCPDVESTKSLAENTEYYICGFEYVQKGTEFETVRAYLGTAKYIPDTPAIDFFVKAQIENKIVIDNLRKITSFDLWNDFREKKDDENNKEYVMVEESEYAAQLIDLIINEPYTFPKIERKYDKASCDDSLSPLAQRNEYCDRQYNLRETQPDRSEFQRDYERILHSKAFRRLVDKAQIFSAAKGDHYRTRMTHSQTVAQIARSIACELKLNMNLTEAIALGHDIGHTPFGHQGERTLDSILNNEIKIINNWDSFEGNLGGFKHNYQSVRVASVLEEKYYEINGMDLSFQTLEGLLKHTKTKPEYSLSEFFPCDDAEEKLHMDLEFCSTLEGQVVALADEIAQRGHDLDDAISSGLITLEDLNKFTTINKAQALKKTINLINTNMKEYLEKNTRRVVDEKDLLAGRIVSAIISYFIKDAIAVSKANIENYDPDDFKSHGYTVTEKLIALSKEALEICNYLDTVISNRVISSSEVALFDSNADTIVRGLFKAYYNNPRLLHKGTLRRMCCEIRRQTHNVIDFETANCKMLKEELARMTKTLGIKSDDTTDATPASAVNEAPADNAITVSAEEFEEYMIKREILVRCICDFISGMTDTYAINEYNRIIKQL